MEHYVVMDGNTNILGGKTRTSGNSEVIGSMEQ